MKNNFNIIISILLILFAAISRLVPHPMNFAPITAMALFSAVYLDRKLAFIIPIGALLISDAFIGFYHGIWWVYGTFALIGFIGIWLRKHLEAKSTAVKALYVYLTTLGSSVIFFIVTNFGVWLSGYLYEMNLDGLIKCYVMAIPFFRNTVAGDLFYVTVMFGMYEFISRYAVKQKVSPLGDEIKS